MTNPKVLVGTIFSEVKDYAIPDWFRTVKGFTYPGFDFCAVDNSKDKKYHEKMFKYFSDRKKNSNIQKLSVLHTPRGNKRSEVFMVDSSNALRKKFLDGGCDWLLYIECDQHPDPKDVIERMISYNRQIVSAIYFTGDKGTSYPMMGGRNSFFNEDSEMYIMSYLRGFYDIGSFEIPKLMLTAGLGCVLMHREVMEKVSFRHDPTFSLHHDGTFAEDLWKNWIVNCYVPIMCRHENQNWEKQFKMIKSM